jgi:toxin ParE1/3/4
MPRVQLTRPAHDDLRSVWLHIARDNVSAADRLIDRVFDQCRLYSSQPAAGTAVDRLQPGLRCFSIGNYVIFFRHEPESLLVVRVLHGARNIEELFKQ